MLCANTGWGAPRVQGELLKLGIVVDQATVGRWIRRFRKTMPTNPPSQTWRTFLENHVNDIVAIDFFVVPTATFSLLYSLVILSHDRRRMLHVNVTDHPTAQWTAQQIVNTFPWESAPRYLLRDRDNKYGEYFRRRIKSMGIEQVVTAPQSPWQNPYVERVIGSIRRDCTNHLIVINDRHLLRILKSYQRYYNESRCHLSLGKDTPQGREVHPPDNGEEARYLSDSTVFRGLVIALTDWRFLRDHRDDDILSMGKTGLALFMQR
jgi:transposase InsO family protein